MEISKSSIFNDLTYNKVGHVCKVYWDQDDVWYTGRILLYDVVKKLHLIYFEIDQTSEWIDTSSSSDDFILLADELALHRHWPVIKFVGSDKGLKYTHHMNGHLTGTNLIIFFVNLM